jgi:hypothetical protein
LRGAPTRKKAVPRVILRGAPGLGANDTSASAPEAVAGWAAKAGVMSAAERTTEWSPSRNFI